MLNRRQLLTGLCGSALTLCDVQEPRALFRTRAIPLGMTTNRLRDIHLDADGNAWIGANEPDRHIPVVHLQSGKAWKFDMNLGEGQYLDMLLPIGDKLVVCGGSYPRQVFVHRKTGQKSERPLLTPRPLIYGGIIVGQHAYLFDCEQGLYRWNARDETGEFYPYTPAGRPLVGGVYVPQKQAIYGVPWWQEGMPVTHLIRFHTRTKQYDRVFVPPWPDVRPMSPIRVGDTLYQTDMFGGTMLVFDLNAERWTMRCSLPGYEKLWKYAATATLFGPYVLCCLSTFQGVKNANGTYGFDGHRHHFVNHILAFDTRDRTAALIPVPGLTPDGYATLAYLRTLRGRLYGTCVNSTVLPDGKPGEHGPAYLTEFLRS
jgi:hypothetical protein